MRILSKWMYTKNGLKYRAVEYTDKEQATIVRLMDFLQGSIEDHSGNKDSVVNTQDM